IEDHPKLFRLIHQGLFAERVIPQGFRKAGSWSTFDPSALLGSARSETRFFWTYFCAAPGVGNNPSAVPSTSTQEKRYFMEASKKRRSVWRRPLGRTHARRKSCGTHPHAR